MIRPSEVNTDVRFMDSQFQNAEREIVARNITHLNQAVAFERDDDRWQPFTMEDYVTYRNAISEGRQQQVGMKERGVIHHFTNKGYLDIDNTGHYTVTNRFLGVVAQFVKPEATEEVIAR